MVAPVRTVIVGSTRPGRAAAPVADWFAGRAEAHGRFAPFGFVSYGGVAAGTRVVQQLKQVVTTLPMAPVPEAVNIPFHARSIDDDGRLQADDVMEQAADAMLDELWRVQDALRPLRAAVSQVA